MPKAEELYDKWTKNCPKEVDLSDFEKVAKHYLGDWLRQKSGTSHMYIIEHPALAYHPAFGSNSTLSVAVKSGRKVKGVYIDHLLKAIHCVTSYERIVNKKESKK